MEKIKVGSDIEVFLVREDGSYMSAIGLIGGSKQNPLPLEKEGCAIQEDNVALEYNVPAVDISEHALMWQNIQYVLNAVRKSGKIPKGVEIMCCSSAKFADEELDNPKAQEFGCEPDFNAWDEGRPNPRPTPGGNLRSCGGHIHISYPNPSIEATFQLVQAFDMFLGVPSVLVDTDSDRRKLYGKAGAFRFKSWGEEAGFEYRVLSNWWTSRPEYVKWVFNQIELAFEFVRTNQIGVLANEGDICKTINESDAVLAEILVNEFNIALPKLEEHVEV